MKLFFKSIPVLLFLFLLMIIYQSCNEAPIESNSSRNTESTSNSESSQTEVNQSSTNKDALSSQNELTTKTNSDTGSKSDPGQTDDICTSVNISPNVNIIYIPSGTNYTWNFTSRASIFGYTNNRHHIIYIDGNPYANYDNWFTGNCGFQSAVVNNINSSLSLGAGNHTIGAKVVWTDINEVPHEMWAYAYVNVSHQVPPVPNVTGIITGQIPNRRPYLSWGAVGGGVTNYVVQKRIYPGGTFSDLITLNSNTLSFTDNTVTAVTNRFDVVYQKYEYRVRSVNGAGSSGYQQADPLWYNHGCFSTLGYHCNAFE